jgi:ATP/maltotriose-dependent transcriptional regulator MalT
MKTMDDMKALILDKMPLGVIVIDRKFDIIFRNRRSELFLKRYQLPEEIKIICRRIFDAISAAKLHEFFPGDINIVKRLEGSSSHWLFKIYIGKEPVPFVTVFIMEESLSNKIDLNKIRSRFRLTRREADVLGHVINGLKNSDIAHILEISEQTVKDHLSNIYIKLGADNRITLVGFLLNYAQLPNDD